MMVAMRSARRRGLTLVEMVAAMATITMVLGVTVAVLTILLKLSDSGRTHSADESAIARAARIFRQDVHSAGLSISRPSGKPSALLTLKSNDGFAVEYVAERDGILRVESQENAVVSQERLSLPDHSFPRFERREVEGRTFLSLVFDRRATKTDSGLAARSFRIEAALGTISRFDPMGGAR